MGQADFSAVKASDEKYKDDPAPCDGCGDFFDPDEMILTDGGFFCRLCHGEIYDHEGFMRPYDPYYEYGLSRRDFY